MFVRILTVGMVLLLAVGCAKRNAKKTAPSPDDTATVKPANGKDAKGKADEPNFLNDPRFKKDPPTGLAPDGTTKQPWAMSPPEGGWQPGAGGTPVPAPGVPNPAGVGVLQPQPVPEKPPVPPTAPKYSPVSEADMKEIWVFIENASGASGKMPSQLLTYQALVAAESKAAPLVKDGSIFLTGATTRENIWAYETQALTSGGLVATQNGVETLTAAELKTRLGK